MNEKVIKIKTNKEKVHHQILEIMNSFIGLRKNERKVLGEFLYFYDTMKDIPSEHRWNLIFCKETRKKIREKLDISESVLNNNITFLRKKKLISSSGILSSLITDVGNEYVLKFIFKLDEKRIV